MFKQRKSNLFKRLSLCITIFYLLSCSPSKAETWKIAAIENWPPYMDKNLKEQSIGFIALQSLLNKIGVTLEIHYLPWRRAKHLPLVDNSFIGYYCAWLDEVDAGFFPSIPIFSSPIGLISKKKTKLDQAQINNLSQMKVGLVSSYTYPEPFENLPRQSRVKDDATLIKFVLIDRIDYAVIDRYVFNYLMQTSPTLKAIKDQIIFHDGLIEEKPLVLAFRNTVENHARAKRLADAIHQDK